MFLCAGTSEDRNSASWWRNHGMYRSKWKDVRWALTSCRARGGSLLSDGPPTTLTRTRTWFLSTDRLSMMNLLQERLNRNQTGSHKHLLWALNVILDFGSCVWWVLLTAVSVSRPVDCISWSQWTETRHHIMPCLTCSYLSVVRRAMKPLASGSSDHCVTTNKYFTWVTNSLRHPEFIGLWVSQ